MTTAAQTAFEPDYEYELVDGKLEAKEMAGAKHGSTIMRLGAKLVNHVEESDLGNIYSPDTTFIVGRNERLPDLAFVSASRIPDDGEPEGIWEIAPDLAVEVISPNDIWEKVTAKIEDYFAAGVRQVWLVSFRQRNVSVYDSPTKVTILTENEDLTCEAILPGFHCRISEIFGKKRIAENQSAE